MEDFYEVVIKFVNAYGLPLTLLALSGNVVIGILRLLHVFDKVEKEKQKYLYFGISFCLSTVACISYLLITKQFNGAVLAVLIPVVFLLSQMGYSVYENIGVRGVLRWIWDKIASRISQKKNSKSTTSPTSTSASSSKAATDKKATTPEKKKISKKDI